ncbi:hypothetical protein F2P81_019636 [Scomber scombrus]|uniref:Uncharacterized protein n=1 Tax=Scomber scombrus TaxID=13677 RepID=A0AAV1PC33_SCOSC
MGKSLGIWLLTLAVVTLFSASEVDSIKLLCCMGGNPEEVHNIKKCFEQVRRVDCNYHAFLENCSVLTSSKPSADLKSWMMLTWNKSSCPEQFLIIYYLLLLLKYQDVLGRTVLFVGK